MRRDTIPIILENETKRKIKEVKKFFHVPKYVRVVKSIVLLIPLLILAYLLYANVLVSQEFNYFYDIGTGKENVLSPVVRVSEPVIEGSYRNLISQLVYFNVPIARGAERVDVEIRYKNVFQNKTVNSFVLGAQDSKDEWHYKWNNLPVNAGLGEWGVTSTSFNLSNLTVVNGKLSMVFNVRHLNPNITQYVDRPVPIDWINVTVYKPGLFGGKYEE